MELSFPQDRSKLVPEEAADRALAQEIMCDPAEHPLAQRAESVTSSPFFRDAYDDDPMGIEEGIA
jgi:hypothetical protein